MDTIGLMLNFIGSVIIIFFNLPPSVNPSGHINLILEQEDEGEKKKQTI
jgi:hypothetical protein